MTVNLDSWIQRVQSAKSRDEIIELLVVALEIVRDELEAERSDGGLPLLDEAPTQESADTEFVVDSKPISHSVVELSGWYGWPIHCPFCGAPVGGEPLDAGQACRHLLYVAGLGSFFYLSGRLAMEAGLEGWEDPWTFTDRSIDGKLGGIDRFLEAAETFPNYVRFRDFSPNDVGEVGFAAYQDELHIWGQEPRDPHVV